MKIAIDVQTTVGQKSGFGFYVSNLVKNLKQIDPKNEYILIEPNCEYDLSTPQRFIWDQIKFPFQARKQKADVIYQPCFSVPIFTRAKKAVTIHDVISIHFPQNLPFFSRLFYSMWMPFSYRFADSYIASSEHTKNDVVKLLKIKPEKIKVVYLAAGEEYYPMTSQEDKGQIEAVKNKYKITGKYILHIGTLEPRKNLMFLVKAFAEVVKNSSISEKLVIAGKKGWYYEGLFKLVDQLNLKDRVVFTGYVEDQDIPYLYNGATAFVFPSIYEGFGLPPLEAMSCGCPVISSNTSSLPEVVGEAGILVDPKDKDRWVKSMSEVLEDKELQKKMSKKGIDQSRKFSWKKAAQEVIEIFEKL